MAQQTINIGSAPNDSTGDTIRDGGDKINDNFTELYAADAALGTVATLDTDTDGTLAANSDTLIATQKAVKTAIAAAVLGLYDLKTGSDCSANPNYPSALKGDAYWVTVAGKIGGASGTVVEVGDIYLATADNAGGTQAAVGTSWTIIQGNVLAGGGGYTPGGTDVALADGGTGASLTDPNADRILFWDDSAGAVTWLTAGTGLSITGTTLSASGGGGGIYDANWFDVTDAAYGALGDGTTDDTAAIQAAIDACEAAGGGTVYFPRGIYVVNGALQDTSRSNAQLVLPKLDAVDTEAITIEFRGECPPSVDYSVIGATPVANNLSVIKGTLNTTGGTAPCLIGSHGPVGTANNFTNILFVMRDLSVEMPANPVLTAVDASCVAQFQADNLVIHAGSFDAAAISMQTTSTSYGLRVPAINNGAMTSLGVVTVIGYYNGIEIAEHTVGRNVTAVSCKRGFVSVASTHSSAFVRMQTIHCQTGLVFTGGEHAISIQQFNIEHASSGTWVPTYDIDDASNYGRGYVYWHVVLAGTGAGDGFLSNGAVYFRRERLGRVASVFGLTDAATVTINCNHGSGFRWTIAGNRTFANPTNPYDGQVINVRIIQDGTGSRTWTLGSKFKFPGGSPVLSTTAAAKDFVSCQYDATDDTWNCAISKAMA